MKQYKLKEHVTDEQVKEYLKTNWYMNDNNEIEMMIAVCVGFHIEVTNILSCDFYGDELDFTYSHHEYSNYFDKQLDELYQDLIVKGMVIEV